MWSCVAASDPWCMGMEAALWKARLALALAAVAAAAEEERWAAFSQPGWDYDVSPDPYRNMITILALRQRNLDFLEDRARHVSDPAELEYGSYYTRDEVNHLSSPADADVAVVHGFLSATRGEIQFSKGKDLVRFICTVACTEKTFGTRLRMVKGPTQPGSSPFRAVEPIQLPASVAEALDGVSLNAPVFMPLRPKEPAPKPFVYPANGRTAPRISPRLISGDRFVALRFVAYCKDGRVNQDRVEEGICSSSPSKSTIVSFEVILLQEPDMQHAIVIPAVEKVLGQHVGDCGPEVKCVEFNITTAVENYANTTAMVRAHFSDGSVSNFSSTMEVASTWPLPYVTPHMLEHFYHMRLNKPISHPRNIISVVEFLGQYYNPEDLEAFFRLMGVPSWGFTAHPRLIGRDIPRAGSVYGGEAQLDIQYIMSMAQNVTTWFWSVPGTELSTMQEPFLDWLMQVADSDDQSSPLVHSVSYGDEEAGMPVWFKRRVNFEFMKLALRGISVLVASGDDGVSGTSVADKGPEFCRSASPEFPASSPWVTAVGGTQLAKASSPVCGYSSGNIVVTCHYEGEVVCSSATGGGITSGGGFSSDFDIPWYQRHAVRSYLEQRDAPVPSRDGPWGYNSTGRGYPDISALASNYLVWMGPHLESMSGTSASTPLVAAMVAQLNEKRLQLGLPALGFLNPLLYRLAERHPEVFNDIVVGNNRCSRSRCCEIGFGASRGWDAVSGVGSPRFDALAALLDPGAHSGSQAIADIPGLAQLVAKGAPSATAAQVPAVAWDVQGLLPWALCTLLAGVVLADAIQRRRCGSSDRLREGLLS